MSNPIGLTNSAHGTSGFTLMEAIVVVALLSILSVLGVPSLMTTLRNNQSIAQNNNFIAALHLARSTAVTRRKPVTVCASSSGTACTANTNWAVGYIVLDGSTVIQAQPAMEGGASFVESASASTLSFNGYGETSTAYQFTFTPKDCTSAAVSKRVIAIAVTGRVTTSNTACP